MDMASLMAAQQMLSSANSGLTAGQQQQLLASMSSSLSQLSASPTPATASPPYSAGPEPLATATTYATFSELDLLRLATDSPALAILSWPNKEQQQRLADALALYKDFEPVAGNPARAVAALKKQAPTAASPDARPAVRPCQWSHSEHYHGRRLTHAAHTPGTAPLSPDRRHPAAWRATRAAGRGA